MNISLLLRWSAALSERRRLELHSARAERLSQQAFDLSVDASQIRCGGPLDRGPQGRVDAKRKRFAVVRHRPRLLIERAGVDDGLRVALAAEHDHQI